MQPSSLFSPSPLPSNPFPLLSSKLSIKKKITSSSSTQQTKPNNNNNNNNIPIKIPQPPWITSPLLLSPDQLLDLSQPKSKPKSKTHQKTQSSAYKSLTEKVKGGRSQQAMKKILRSVKNLREIDEEEALEEAIETQPQMNWDGNGLSANVPWARAEERTVFRREKKVRVVTRAERELKKEELGRLREEVKGMRRWVRAKKAGVTPEVVEEIVRGWRKEELVMVKFVDPLRRNMDRAREIVEFKTGGLVIWSKKDILVVYRGNYQLSGKPFHGSAPDVAGQSSQSALSLGRSDGITDDGIVQKNIEVGHLQLTGMDWALHDGAGSITESLYVREANRLLNSLGPRFIDWWWQTPLPVDADLLPEVVPDFKPPFRLCPPKERPKLRDDELTYLRKLARSLPTHFALGKNTKLQGLAAAIIKLWEKSLIAKIAIKVGIPHTNNEHMAEELKRLTGGVLILRNKFFIILYRGKDFLPGKVASSVHEREIELHDQQLQEEEARAKASKSFINVDQSVCTTSNIGTFSEFKDIQADYLPLNNGTSPEKIKIEAEKENLTKELKDEEHKLFILNLKIEKSEKELATLNSSCNPSEQSADQELLTEEERQAFRRIGLKMDEFLLLGRRGIYDGTIESIRQHWKHREVVKIITMQKAFQQITYTAQLLEIESAGILIAVEKLRRGHAIIIYRGKNYHRMLKPASENLLNKREALQRSIEIQRRGSMKYFARQKQQTIRQLKQRLRYLDQRLEELDTKGVQDRS